MLSLLWYKNHIYGLRIFCSLLHVIIEQLLYCWVWHLCGRIINHYKQRINTYTDWPTRYFVIVLFLTRIILWYMLLAIKTIGALSTATHLECSIYKYIGFMWCSHWTFLWTLPVLYLVLHNSISARFQCTVQWNNTGRIFLNIAVTEVQQM